MSDRDYQSATTRVRKLCDGMNRAQVEDLVEMIRADAEARADAAADVDAAADPGSKSA